MSNIDPFEILKKYDPNNEANTRFKNETKGDSGKTDLVKKFQIYSEYLEEVYIKKKKDRESLGEKIRILDTEMLELDQGSKSFLKKANETYNND